MIAIILSLVAVALSIVCLAAVGTMALKLRVVRPRPSAQDGSGPQPVGLPATGRPIEEVLGPLVEITVDGPDGKATFQDRYLMADGPVLATATTCGSCHFLLREAHDLLVSADVRLLVAAHTVDRGIEFVEKDCGISGVQYQVDVDGVLVNGLGIDSFPLTFTVTDGIVGPAHLVATRAHLQSVLTHPSRAAEAVRTPAATVEE